jgi:uroporphyrinogen-III synthase
MRLGITRTAEQLSELMAVAQRRGVEIVPLPLTEIEYLNPRLPEGFKLDSQDWVIFTSGNCVDAFQRVVEQRAIKLPAKFQIAAVGKKTQEAVEEAGWTVDYLPSEPYGKLLFEQFIARHQSTKCRVIYARAEHVNLDPDVLFESAGIEYLPLVCYRTLSRKIDSKTIDGLTSADAILFTAPSAVRAFAEQFGKPRARVIAIGGTTAAQIEKLDWGKPSIMPEPDIEKVLELV